MKKSHFILGTLSIVSLAMSACVSPAPVNSVIPKDAQFVSIDTVNANANATSAKKDAKPIVYVVDLNKGVKNAKPGASVVINIAPPKDSFKTKASSNGKNSLAVSSVRVNLCTDPTRPFNTRMAANLDGFIVSRTGVASGSQLTTIVFQNVPPGGPYSATFTADSTALGATATLGEGFVMPDNNGTVYAAPDAGARIAVSSNTVTVSNALALTPANQVLTISANMQVTGAMVDTNVTTTDVGTPTFGAI